MRERQASIFFRRRFFYNGRGGICGSPCAMFAYASAQRRLKIFTELRRGNIAERFPFGLNRIPMGMSESAALAGIVRRRRNIRRIFEAGIILTGYRVCGGAGGWRSGSAQGEKARLDSLPMNFLPARSFAAGIGADLNFPFSPPSPYVS